MIQVFRQFEGRGDAYQKASERVQEEYLSLQEILKRECERVSEEAELLIHIETKGTPRVKYLKP